MTMGSVAPPDFMADLRPKSPPALRGVPGEIALLPNLGPPGDGDSRLFHDDGQSLKAREQRVAMRY